LKPGGELLIVDFYDQADLPAPFRRFLQWWLSRFHVRFPAELMPYLASLGSASVEVKQLFHRYCFIARLKKT